MVPNVLALQKARLTQVLGAFLHGGSSYVDARPKREMFVLFVLDRIRVSLRRGRGLFGLVLGLVSAQQLADADLGLQPLVALVWDLLQLVPHSGDV